MGLAVVPLVYMMYSGCSASKACASCSVGLPIHHARATRRRGASSHATSCPVRRTTSTCSTSGHSRDRLVDGGLERARRAAPVAAVRRDDEVGVAVENAAAQGVGGEAAEDDGVGCAEAGAGQHGDHRLGDHRHVDGDLVPGPHTELGEGVRRLADRGPQFGVGDRPRVARLALPVEGDPVAESRRHVAVDAVDGHVELAADEPLGERGLATPGPATTARPTSTASPAPPRSRADRPAPRRRCPAARWRPWPDSREAGRSVVSCNRADSPCSWLSLMWSPRARPARPPCLAEGRATGRGSPRPSELEPLERERGGHGRPDERVTAQRAGRLPHARLHHRLRCLSGRHIGPDDVRRAPPVRPLESELERVAARRSATTRWRRCGAVPRPRRRAGGSRSRCRRAARPESRRPPRSGGTNRLRDGGPGRGRR